MHALHPRIKMLGKGNPKPVFPNLKSVCFIAVILLCNRLHGQPLIEIHPELFIGFNIPVGKEFSHVHFIGLSSGATLFITAKEKFSIGPSLLIQYHRKNINEGAKDELTGTAFGLMADYSIIVFKGKLRVYPQAGIFSQGISDCITARNGYRGNEIKILEAKDVAFLFGGSLEVKRIRLALQYKLFNAPVQFNKDLFNDFAKHNQHYTIFTKEVKTNMDFSSLSIQLTYRF
jgi:hypothetical protein